MSIVEYICDDCGKKFKTENMSVVLSRGNVFCNECYYES